MNVISSCISNDSNVIQKEKEIEEKDIKEKEIKEKEIKEKIEIKTSFMPKIKREPKKKNS